MDHVIENNALQSNIGLIDLNVQITLQQYGFSSLIETNDILANVASSKKYHNKSREFWNAIEIIYKILVAHCGKKILASGTHFTT